MRHRRGLAILIAAALGLAAPAAFAQSLAPAPAISAREAADQKIVMAVLASGSLQAMVPHIAELRDVLEHAPASYPRIEQRGDLVIIRDEDVPATANLALLLGAAAQRRSLTVRREFNTYGNAAMLLASIANEGNLPQAALTITEHWLKLQPDNPKLVNEKIAALEIMHRPAEALSAADQWLTTVKIAADADRARMLRAKGYALTELKRLDEAQAAYQDSLKLQPGHQGALNELIYIARQKQGQAPTSSVMTTSDKAVTGAYQTPQPPPPKP